MLRGLHTSQNLLSIFPTHLYIYSNLIYVSTKRMQSIFRIMTSILSSSSFAARTSSACRRFQSCLLSQGQLINSITLRPASATSATSDIHDGNKQFGEQNNEQPQSSASNKEFEKVRPKIILSIFYFFL